MTVAELLSRLSAYDHGVEVVVVDDEFEFVIEEVGYEEDSNQVVIKVEE